MDISQSPLMRYKSNKSGNTKSSSEVRNSPETVQSKDAAAGSEGRAAAPVVLKEGQVLKGRIIDHRYNEVKLQAEPGGQIITARLSGNVPLSIGQDAQFIVTGDSDHLVLKYLPGDTAAPEEAILFKALTASNLPVTQRNRSLAAELLNQRMPLDSRTLRTLIRMSAANRDASPQALVLLLKNKIPVTPENLKLLEAYRLDTKRLSQDIQQISQALISLVKDQSSAVDINAKLLGILYPEKQGSSPLQVPISEILSPEELTQLEKAFSQKTAENITLSSGMTGNALQLIRQGTINLNEAVLLAARLNQFNPEQLSSLKLQASPEIFTQGNSNIDSQVNPDLFNQAGRNIITQAGADISAQIIPDLSAQAEPANPLKTAVGLTSLSDPAFVQSDLIQSDLIPTASDTAGILNKLLNRWCLSLSMSDSKFASKLLTSPEYSKLLTEEFLHKWSITPEKLAEKEPVLKLFREMKDNLEQLSSLIKSTAADDMPQLQEPVKNMQDNLQFIRDLNEVYTYLPLPVQFKNSEVHTDLYVLTRKDALKDKGEDLRILLHLDMANLGPLNVHIQLHQKRITADFYTDNSEAGNLIGANLPSLIDILQSKGYLASAQVRNDYKKPDFCSDFLEQNSQENSIRSYTFDIRT